jgi:hypothetical protein
MLITEQAASYTVTGQPAVPGGAPDGNSWLAYCFGDPEGFLTDAWSRAPFGHQGTRRKFRALFGMDELSQLLSMGAIASSQIRLVKDGKAVPSRLWVDMISSAVEGRPTLVPDVGRIRDIVLHGYTLTVSAMQTVSTGIFRLCSGLETELSHRIKANVYFTPRSSQGFGAHCDENDVIVLQLEGEKEWKIFDRYSGSLRGPRNVALPHDAEPQSVFRLKAGDTLYLPRGYVHSVAASAEQPSLHISVGVQLATVGDLLEHAVRAMSRAPELDRPINARFSEHSAELPGLLIEAAGYLQRRLGDADKVAQVAAGFRGSWSSHRAEIADLSGMHRK